MKTDHLDATASTYVTTVYCAALCLRSPRWLLYSRHGPGKDKKDRTYAVCPPKRLEAAREFPLDTAYQSIHGEKVEKPWPLNAFHRR